MTNRFGNNLLHNAANEPLVKALVDCGVRFIVIGGLAISWHCCERSADDMDLLVEPTAENSERIVRALARLGLRGYSNHDFANYGRQIPLKGMQFADLLTPQQEDATYEEILGDAVNAALFNMPVHVASISSLIRMKTAASHSGDDHRAKHLKDIAILETRALRPRL